MEINDQTYAALQQYLRQTLDPRTQKQGLQKKHNFAESPA